MKIITKIREQAAITELRKEVRNMHRTPRVISLEKARNIGVLYYLPDERSYRIVSGFVKQLQDDGKNVKALAYVEDKRLTGQFLPKLSYDFLYPSGLKWNYRPNASMARDFIDTEFDILIDLNTGKYLPLTFLTALSKARFKAGLESEYNKNYLDMMISLKKDVSLEDGIREMKHYLSLINRKNEA